MQELGGSMARQTARLASGNVLYHGCHAQFRNGGWSGRRNTLFHEFQLSPLFFSFPGVRSFCEFKLLRKFHLSFLWVWQVLQNSWVWLNLWALGYLWIPWSLLVDWLLIGHQAVRKILLLVLHFHYYYDFLCCLIKLFLSQPMSIPFCPFSSPSHQEEGEGGASGCLVLNSQLPH